LALGICYVQLGRQGEAEATLRRYLRLAPNSAAGHAALGIALLGGTNTAEAKAELERAVRLDRKQVDARQALARIYLIEGRADKAISFLRPLISLGASDEALTLLGEALIRSGRGREAASMLERRLEANPPPAPQIYALAGWAHLEAGNMARAAEICERGMRIYPDSEIEAVYLSLPAAYLAERVGARIERLRDAPDVAEMIALGRVLIDADPHRRTRSNEIAEEILLHAIELAPTSASARYNYGRALSQSNPARALAEWETALALNPDDQLRLQILIKIAATRVDLSEFEAAERAFQAALELNRKLPRRNPEAMLEYVRFLQLRAQMAEAEALLEEILSWNPLSPGAHLERARLLAARGRWKEVAEEGEFILRAASQDKELLRSAHALLARAYHSLNQPEKARWHRSWLDSH
jgi:tetratricopeptide (TPR) repeat protein